MKVQVIIGSSRPGRVSDRVAKWVVNELSAQNVDVETVDLIDYRLPFFDELISPQYNPSRTPGPEVQKWLDKINEADAYVIVTPEYNRSYSAVLKNAIDHIDYQFSNKPVALVAHGSTGGASAVSHLRGALPGVLAVTVPKAVYLSAQPGTAIDDDGNLSEELKANPYGPQAALTATVEQLAWYGNALAAARVEA